MGPFKQWAPEYPLPPLAKLDKHCRKLYFRIHDCGMGDTGSTILMQKETVVTGLDLLRPMFGLGFDPD